MSVDVEKVHTLRKVGMEKVCIFFFLVFKIMGQILQHPITLEAITIYLLRDAG